MSDAGLELLIGRVLRIGVTTSSICLAAGLLLSLVVPGAGLMLLNVGILLLIATPAARVVLSIVEYVIARDWPFTLLTTIVLMELVAGAVAAVLFHKKL
jgi:uncharacterized membrane protein